MARDNTTKRYSRIQPWYTDQEIKDTLSKAAYKPPTQHNSNTTHTSNRLMHSQTHADILPDSVARRATNLEEYVVPSTRQTRQSKKD